MSHLQTNNGGKNTKQKSLMRSITVKPNKRNGFIAFILTVFFRTDVDDNAKLYTDESVSGLSCAFGVPETAPESAGSGKDIAARDAGATRFALDEEAPPLTVRGLR